MKSTSHWKRFYQITLVLIISNQFKPQPLPSEPQMHATIPRLPRREMKFLQLSYLSSDVFCSQFLIVPSLATSKPQTTRATHKSTIIFLPPVVSWYFLSATDRGKIFTSYQTNSHKQHQPASTSLSLGGRQTTFQHPYLERHFYLRHSPVNFLPTPDLNTVPLLQMSWRRRRSGSFVPRCR